MHALHGLPSLDEGVPKYLGTFTPHVIAKDWAMYLILLVVFSKLFWAGVGLWYHRFRQHAMATLV